MSKLIKKIFDELTFFGGIAFSLFLILLLFILGRVRDSLNIFIGTIIIYFITLIIRLFYYKKRPNYESYNNFLEKLDSSSFPSVHAARIMFLVIYALISFNILLYVKFLLGIIFILVIFSRIYLKKHDMVDIFGGIIVGILTSIISLIF